MPENQTQGLTELNTTLGAMLNRAADMKQAFTEIAQRHVSDTQENFRLGGRPRWEPSIRVKKHGGQTLLLSGRLMKSITIPEVTPTGFTLGSNLPYARAMQEGAEIKIAARSETFQRNRYVRGDKKGKFKRGTKEGRGFTIGAYTIDIDPRPYIVFRPEMVAEDGKILLGHLLGNR
jgi:phage gpG-like protein